MRGDLVTASQPSTGPIPTQSSLTPEAIRAVEAFAQHCDRRADRARSLIHTATWRSAARLARHYIRTHS